MTEMPSLIYALVQRSECGHAPGITYSLGSDFRTDRLSPVFTSAGIAEAYRISEDIDKSYRVTPLVLVMPKLKLWLITRTDAAEYGTFRSGVIAAYTEEEALSVSIYVDSRGEETDACREWLDCDAKTVVCVGWASDNIQPNTVINSDFYRA